MMSLFCLVFLGAGMVFAINQPHDEKGDEAFIGSIERTGYDERLDHCEGERSQPTH